MPSTQRLRTASNPSSSNTTGRSAQHGRTSSHPDPKGPSRAQDSNRIPPGQPSSHAVPNPPGGRQPGASSNSTRAPGQAGSGDDAQSSDQVRDRAPDARTTPPAASQESATNPNNEASRGTRNNTSSREERPPAPGDAGTRATNPGAPPAARAPQGGKRPSKKTKTTPKKKRKLVKDMTEPEKAEYREHVKKTKEIKASSKFGKAFSPAGKRLNPGRSWKSCSLHDCPIIYIHSALVAD